jgi:hypothetical protein
MTTFSRHRGQCQASTQVLDPFPNIEQAEAVGQALVCEDSRGITTGPVIMHLYIEGVGQGCQ